MTAFPEWGEVAKDPLLLPIQGNTYTIPALGYLDEIKIRAAQDRARKAADAGPNDDAGELPDAEPISDEQFLRMMLGGALAQMRADNVPGMAIVHAAAVAHTDATLGRQQALYVWERGLDPKALMDDMAAVRKALSQVDEATAPTAPTKAKKPK